MRRASSSSSSPIAFPPPPTFSLLLLLLLLLASTQRCPGSRVVVVPPRCDPSRHICEGRCPDLPPGNAPEEGGVCLRDAETEACVCWLRNDPSTSSSGHRLHLQTLFKCDVLDHNGTVRHVMCLPPAPCFAPDTEWGCMIVPHCPCAAHGRPAHGFRWQSVVAFVLRSRTTLVRPQQEEPTADHPSSEEEEDRNREFGLRHLLFLVAFVVAPLLCWCTLTFFNGSRCIRRKKKRTTAAEEQQPLPTERREDTDVRPSAPPKPTENPPPPYEAAVDGGGDPCRTTMVDCESAPPPSYEDAIRDRRPWPSTEV